VEIIWLRALGRLQASVVERLAVRGVLPGERIVGAFCAIVDWGAKNSPTAPDALCKFDFQTVWLAPSVLGGDPVCPTPACAGGFSGRNLIVARSSSHARGQRCPTIHCARVACRLPPISQDRIRQGRPVTLARIGFDGALGFLSDAVLNAASRNSVQLSAC